MTLAIPDPIPGSHRFAGETNADQIARIRDTVVLWKDGAKSAKAGDDGSGALPLQVTIPEGKSSVDVFIEGKSPAAGVNASRSVRDMLIAAEVAGAETDRVSFTFIWAQFDDDQVKHDRGEARWADITDPPATAFDVVGDFGLQARVEEEVPGTGRRAAVYRNVIGLQATVCPPGIENEGQVKFDVARDKEVRNWIVTIRGEIRSDPAEDSDFPRADEQPNDEGGEADESTGPNANRHMFSVDAPRVNGDPKEEDFLVIRTINFREWLRIRVDEKDPGGNQVDGARCSAKFLWRSRHLLRAIGGRWRRILQSNGQVASPELAETPANQPGLGNDIAPGRIALPLGINFTPDPWELEVTKERR